MASTYNMMDSCGKRSFSEQDFEFDKLELYKGDQIVEVSKFDVEVLARHFGLIAP